MKTSTAVCAAVATTLFAVAGTAQAMSGGTLATSPGAVVAVNPGCNGVAIGKRWVVTSAYCLEGMTSTRIKIRAGNLNWSLAPETPTCDTAYENGLGLVQVTEDLPVTPARLAGSDPKPGTPVTLVGWGATDTTDPAELLRTGDGTVIGGGSYWADQMGGRGWGIRMSNASAGDGDPGSAVFVNGSLAGVQWGSDTAAPADLAVVSIPAHLAFIKKTTGITRSSTQKEITSCPETPLAPGS